MTHRCAESLQKLVFFKEGPLELGLHLALDGLLHGVEIESGWLSTERVAANPRPGGLETVADGDVRTA